VLVVHNGGSGQCQWLTMLVVDSVSGWQC